MCSAIGIPGDAGAGVRLGTNEAVRFGMTADDMAELADLIRRAWEASATVELGPVADDVARFRSRFTRLRFIR